MVMERWAGIAYIRLYLCVPSLQKVTLGRLGGKFRLREKKRTLRNKIKTSEAVMESGSGGRRLRVEFWSCCFDLCLRGAFSWSKIGGWRSCQTDTINYQLKLNASLTDKDGESSPLENVDFVLMSTVFFFFFLSPTPNLTQRQQDVHIAGHRSSPFIRYYSHEDLPFTCLSTKIIQSSAD